jgi:ribose transport system substrate-binding protein
MSIEAVPPRASRRDGRRPKLYRRPGIRVVLGAFLGLAVLVLAACSSSGSTAASGSSSGSTSQASGSDASTTDSSFLQNAAIVKLAVSNPQQALKVLYAGQWGKPPATGPKAVTGKNVWMLSCGQIYVACAEQATAFQQAGKILGWHVTIFDTKASTTDEVTGINEAIADHASAIVMPGQDCGSVQAPLQHAISDHIYVINDLSSDCNEPSGSGTRLYSANILDSGYGTWIDFQEAWQSARLAYAIAKTPGPVNIIQLENVQKVSELYDNAGFQAAVAQCSRCHVVDKAVYTFTQVADNQLGQVVSSSLESNPTANVMSVDLDALMPLGVATALEQHSGKRPLVIGSEGLSPNWQYIRDGLQTASVAIDYVWQSWAAADVINRLLAGETAAQIPSEGLGYQAVDATHNLPPGNSLFVAPVNYKAVYTKVWTGQ